MSRRKITMLTDALMGSAGAQNATRQVGVHHTVDEDDKSYKGTPDRESVKVTARKAAQLICDLSYPVERPKP
jgi:hypothetical protein